VAPYPAETLHSFIARMAAANHVDPVTLAKHLQTPAAPGSRPALDRIAAASGRPKSNLRHALPELSGHHGRAHRERPRLACRSCAAARGILTPVTRWVAAHPNVCIRHHRWIGPTVRTIADQHDLSVLPEILAAARHHRRLVRRHDVLHVRSAYNDAFRVNMQWAERRRFNHHRDRRLQLLARPRCVAFNDPAMHAAMYPETVALASIMITVHWVAAAASPHKPDRNRFYTEVARRLDLPTYRTDGLGDALATWAAHESRYALTELLQGPTTPKDATFIHCAPARSLNEHGASQLTADRPVPRSSES